MSKVAALRRQVDRMLAEVQERNAPRIIDCTGARDALIAKLSMYRDAHTEEQAIAEPLTEEEMAAKVQAFKAMLAQLRQDHERLTGVKLVSREDNV